MDSTQQRKPDERMTPPVVKLQHIIGQFSDRVLHLDHRFLLKYLHTKQAARDNRAIGMTYIEGLNGVPNWEDFVFNYTLPLPEWIMKFQFDMMQKYQGQPDAAWNVGLIWSETPSASLGAHFDSDNVYTLQLIGNKIWQIDPPDADRVKRLLDNDSIRPISSRVGFVSSETWIGAKGVALDFHEPTQIILQPGDFLALPAYSLHKVTTDTTSPLTLSCNVGMSLPNNWSTE